MNVVHVIEGIEHERGWGSRPDGLVVFGTKEAALTWISDYNAKQNTAKHAPDEYTVYNYVGIRECSVRVVQQVEAKGFGHYNRISDLTN